MGRDIVLQTLSHWRRKLGELVTPGNCGICQGCRCKLEYTLFYCPLYCQSCRINDDPMLIPSALRLFADITCSWNALPEGLPGVFRLFLVSPVMMFIGLCHVAKLLLCFVCPSESSYCEDTKNNKINLEYNTYLNFLAAIRFESVNLTQVYHVNQKEI